jgi:hypothetical protein
MVAVCIHRNVKDKFRRDLRLLLFLYIIILKRVFFDFCFGRCLYTS